MREPTPIRPEVIRLSRTEWRISDPRLPDADPDRLLGYIERLARRRYEVVWMSDPMRWGYAESFAAALEGLATDDRYAQNTVPEREEAPRVRPLLPLHRIWRRTRIGPDRDVA